MGPRDHRIHLGHGKSPELPPRNHFITNVCFWWIQKRTNERTQKRTEKQHKNKNTVPGPKCRPGDPKSDPALQNPSPGMNKQKMRAEKPCRTQASEFQTEPYSASYGQKPFWRAPVKIMVYLKGQILFSNKEILCSRREILFSRRGILLSRRGILDSRGKILFSKRKIPAFKKGKSCFQEGKSCVQGGNSCFQEGKSCFHERIRCFK